MSYSGLDPSGKRYKYNEEQAEAAKAELAASPGYAAKDALERAYTYIDNALSGLVRRGELDSPLVRDLLAAQVEIEDVKRHIDQAQR